MKWLFNSNLGFLVCGVSVEEGHRLRSNRHVVVGNHLADRRNPGTGLTSLYKFQFSRKQSPMKYFGTLDLRERQLKGKRVWVWKY